MRSIRLFCISTFALLLVAPVATQDAAAQDAVPTTVVVRAVSNDAKLVQDPVGGAHITIEHAETGEVLAEGRQTGDGVTLTLHGFIVEVLSPETVDPAPGASLNVRARVRMMCGCPTEPGGLWDANRYTIRAQLLRDGTVVADAPLSFAGTTSEYTGTISVPEAGATHLRVTATDAGRVNFGTATKSLTAQ